MPVVIDRDPPLHSRIRGLVTRAFTPKRVAEMEPRIVAAASELIEGFAVDGRCDIVERFAWPLPLHVIGDLLGLPREDLPELHRLSNDWLSLFQPIDSVERQIELAQSAVALQRYFYDTLQARVRSPGDDLMSALLEVRDAIDDPLSMVNVMGVPLDLVVAGHVTVTRAIGSALALLLDHPEQVHALRETPELLPGAIEEVLRLQSPAQGLFRKTTRAVALGGVELPAGARLMVHFASANCDERRFADPSAFDPRRAGVGRHVDLGRESTSASVRHSLGSSSRSRYRCSSTAFRGFGATLARYPVESGSSSPAATRASYLCGIHLRREMPSIILPVRQHHVRPLIRHRWRRPPRMSTTGGGGGRHR